MAETTPTGTYEERPKPNWFLWVAAAFFLLLLMSVFELPSGTMKWGWFFIAGLNLAANLIQIYNTSRTRYVLWRRGLSIYLGNTREALIRFDKALMFRPYRGTKDAQADMREFGVQGVLRTYPTFGGRRRWLVIFEAEDAKVRAIVFDPTVNLERMFRERLMEADKAAAPAPAPVAPETPPESGSSEQWTEERQDAPRTEQDGKEKPQNG